MGGVLPLLGSPRHRAGATCSQPDLLAELVTRIDAGIIGSARTGVVIAGTAIGGTATASSAATDAIITITRRRTGEAAIRVDARRALVARVELGSAHSSISVQFWPSPS